MADLITLTCPSCGGELQVTSDADRYVCGRCGNAHIIDPGVHVESLAAVASMLRIEADVRRLRQELRILVQKRDQLRSKVDYYRDSENLRRAARIAACVLAALAVVGVLLVFLNSQNQNFAILTVGAILLSILMGVAGESVKRQELVPHTNSLDDVVKDIVAMERQIVQKQRELETIRQRIDLPPGNADDSIISDMHHVLRTTSP